MKSILLYIVIGMGTIVFSHAQKFDLGITAGANRSTLYQAGEVKFGYDNDFGSQLGLISQYELGKKLFLRGELQYTTYHFFMAWDSYVGPMVMGTATFQVATVRMHAISLPLHLVKQFSIGSGKLDLSVGCQLDYFLNGSVLVRTPSGNNINNIPISNTERTKESPDVSISDMTWKSCAVALKGGVGYQFQRVLLRAQYTYGLTDVDPTNNVGFYGLTSKLEPVNPVRYSGWSVSVSYFFGKKYSNKQ